MATLVDQMQNPSPLLNNEYDSEIVEASQNSSVNESLTILSLKLIGQDIDKSNFD
jgi:hypothetical protein